MTCKISNYIENPPEKKIRNDSGGWNIIANMDSDKLHDMVQEATDKELDAVNVDESIDLVGTRARHDLFKWYVKLKKRRTSDL